MQYNVIYFSVESTITIIKSENCLSYRIMEKLKSATYIKF